MPEQVANAFSDRSKVFRRKLRFPGSAVQLKRACRCNDHHGRGLYSRLAAFDVKELFRTEIRAEASLRHNVIRKAHGRFCGDYAVAAMRDVRKRPSMNECRGVGKRLYKVWLDGIPQKRRHRAVRLEIRRRNRLTRTRITNDNRAKAPL